MKPTNATFTQSIMSDNLNFFLFQVVDGHVPNLEYTVRASGPILEQLLYKQKQFYLFVLKIIWGQKTENLILEPCPKSI